MPNAVTTLKLQHFMTPAAHAHRNLLAPWADKLARDSGGELNLELFTGMSLGGRPDQLFDQSRDGMLDLAWMLPSYNASRFLKSEVFELPFVAAPSARATSLAFQEFAETHAVDEFSEVRPIFFWAHDFGVLCLNRGFKELADLRGRRIRFLTRAQKAMLSALEMVPCQMPIYQAIAAYSKGEIDGILLPWEGARSFGAMKHSSHYIEFDFSPTLYTQTHMMTMNKAAYQRLPVHLQAVIDANSGARSAEAAGVAWDAEADIVRQDARREGEVIALDGRQIAELREAVKPASQYWKDEMSVRGLDPDYYLECARALIDKHSASSVTYP